MAKDEKRKNLTDTDPAGAGPVSDATADAAVEKPWGEGKEFKTEREYIQARVEQARKEQQAHLNKEPGTPGGAPSVETLPGAAADLSGQGKPIGSGDSWSSPE